MKDLYYQLHQIPSYLLAGHSLHQLYGQYQTQGSATKPRRPVRQELPVATATNITVPFPPITGTEFEDIQDRPPVPMRVPVVAGNTAVRQRTDSKRKLRSGRLGKKLQKLNDEIIYRWQRIYPYGLNDTAYPADIDQLNNMRSGGRLQLSHFKLGESPEQVNQLPVYLFDLTCWKMENLNGTVPIEPIVCKRLQFQSTNAPYFDDVYTQFQTHACVDGTWQVERSNIGGTDALPQRQERKAVLKWSDMRMCFYGATQHPTKITIELIQFKDPKFQMNYHPDGPGFGSLTLSDQNEVRAFWLEEVKKLVYHPLDVQNFQRNQAISVLHSESFQIAPDDTTNSDVCPPNVIRRLFKRFNRLVNWDWETPEVTPSHGVEANKNELETPAFQVGRDTNLKDYCNPNARIFLYIRAEDVDPVEATEKLSTPAVVKTLSNTADFVKAASRTDLITEIDNATLPPDTYVCGYDWTPQYASATAPDIFTMYRTPRYCKVDDTPAKWSTTTTPSFDIIIRQKWALQR